MGVGPDGVLRDDNGNVVGFVPPDPMAGFGAPQRSPGTSYGPPLLPGDPTGSSPGTSSSGGSSSSSGASPYWISGGYPYSADAGGALTPDQMNYLGWATSGQPALGYAGAYPGNFPVGGFGGFGGYGGGYGRGGGGGDPLSTMMNAYPSLISAQNQIPLANIGAAAQENVAATQARPGLLSAQNQIPLANINQATQEALGQMGLEGALGSAAIGAQANNTLANAKAGLLGQIGPGISGLMGALTGQISNGNVFGGGPNGSGTNGAPPLPSTQFINPTLLKEGLAGITNQNATRFATLAKQQRQDLADRGFSTTANAAGSVDGLPSELAGENAMRQGMMDQANARDWQIGMAQNNAQQANTVGQMAQQQYNAAQQRILDRLGLGLGFVGGLV